MKLLKQLQAQNNMMKLKIIYKTDGGVNSILEEHLKKYFESIGLEETGSGFNLETNERDICFEYKNNK